VNNELRLKRLKTAINIMDRVAKNNRANFNLCVWNSWSPYANHESGRAQSAEEIERCGTAACFSGWLAISPEVKAEGGWQEGDGSLGFNGDADSVVDSAKSIMNYLGVTLREAANLIYPSHYACNGVAGDERHFNNNKHVGAITPEEVIVKLINLYEKYLGEEL